MREGTLYGDAESSERMKNDTPYSRGQLAVITLLIMAAASIALSIIVIGPFLPGLIWALSFAIVVYPLHRRVSAIVGGPNVAAAISVLIVMLALVLPIALVVWKIGQEVTSGLQYIQEQLASEQWKASIETSPGVANVWNWLTTHIDMEREVRQLGESFNQRLGTWAQTTAWATAQILVALFALFFLLRDRRDALGFVRSLMPLSDRETDYLFEQVRAMTHATIYGTVVVATIQGGLGGLMFMLLGIPGALLWGVAMGVLAVVPTLGAFVVWLPVATALAVQGSWGKAAILAAWGTIVVGLIDNLLYPVLVGKEMRLHTLPVFLSIVGGLVVFGAVGLVLGPVVLAATIAILNILRARTEHARSAQEPTQRKLRA